MNLKMRNEVGARFKLIVRKADTVVRETQWFSNIVLDTGLSRMSSGEWINRCCVGTGNSQPVASQTMLDSFLASTTARQSTLTGANTSVAPFYRWARVTWRFGMGVAAGNISEVGMGWDDSSMWNRARVLDENGAPTTITVLSDEYLDVVAEIRDYPNPLDTGGFALLDKNNNFVSSHTYEVSPYIDSSEVQAFFQKVTFSDLLVYSGGKNPSVTELPNNGIGGTVTASTENPTATSIKNVASLELNTANGQNQSIKVGWRGILATSNGLSYKFQISPPINKTSTQAVTYTIEMSWGRYEPT